MKKGNKSVFKNRRGAAFVLPVIPLLIGIVLVMAGLNLYQMYQNGIEQAKLNSALTTQILSKGTVQITGTTSQQQLSSAGCGDTKLSTLQARTVNPMNLTGVQQLAATAVLVDSIPPLDGSAGVPIKDGITATLTRGSSVAMASITTSAPCPSTGFILTLGGTTGIDSGSVSYDITSGLEAKEIISSNMTNAKFQVYDGVTNISNQAAGPVMTTTAIAMSASGPAKSLEIWVDPITGSAPVGTAMYGNLWALDLTSATAFPDALHKNAFTSISGGVTVEALPSCPFGTKEALSVDVCWKTKERIFGTTKFSLILTPGTGEPTSSTQPALYRITPNFFQNDDGKIWFGAYTSASVYATGVTNSQTFGVT